MEIIADVVCLEDFERALKILLLLQLGAAAAERRSRSVAQPADRLLRLRGEIDEILVQDAGNAIQRAVHFLDATVIKGFGHNASNAGIVNDGRAAALADETVSYEFCHWMYGVKVGKANDVKGQKRRPPELWQIKSPVSPKT